MVRPAGDGLRAALVGNVGPLDAGAHGELDAGEVVGELTLALKGGLGLKTVASTIHPYPTQAEAIRTLGDQYNRTRLTPLLKKVFQGWLAWLR